MAYQTVSGYLSEIFGENLFQTLAGVLISAGLLFRACELLHAQSLFSVQEIQRDTLLCSDCS
jgi:hypothetical protein